MSDLLAKCQLERKEAQEKAKTCYENMEDMRRQKDKEARNSMETYDRISTFTDQIDELNREILTQKSLLE